VEMRFGSSTYSLVAGEFSPGVYSLLVKSMSVLPMPLFHLKIRVHNLATPKVGNKITLFN
jgi:hypothetical protein